MSLLSDAVALHRQGKYEMAEDMYRKALDEDFDNVHALYLLGTIHLQKRNAGMAATLFRQAIALEPNNFECWNNLGNSYKEINKDEDSRRCWEKALSIEGKPPTEYADIYNNLATLYVNAGNAKNGMEYVDKAIQLVPDHVDANWNKSLLLLEQGRFGEGFDLYHWGFKTSNRMFRDYGREIPYWDGSPDKVVVVWGEQGIGDEIMFASILPEMKKVCKQVIFECHPRLIKIFRESFPDITMYPTRKDALINWPHNHPIIDGKIAIGDLGKYFRRNLSDFPNHNGYLKCDQSRVEHYEAKLRKISDKPKVGISWTGGYMKTRKDFRSIPLTDWEPILKQDADFISLQYTPDAYNTIAEAEDVLDVRIHHWPTAVQNLDYQETAALVSALDLVITVNTAVHHLSGALGKTVWTLTPKAKAWRYFSPDGKSFPWYPSAQCIEQHEMKDWKPIMEAVGESLKECVHVCTA